MGKKLDKIDDSLKNMLKAYKSSDQDQVGIRNLKVDLSDKEFKLYKEYKNSDKIKIDHFCEKKALSELKKICRFH